jgi:dTDP-glucose 4,6-dehydratase|tara:strand:- start:619 stop:1512 length:894 start_codon:yes stop_codon:yes gene_type:complete
MKIVVTGGAGFIGSSFANLCLEKGHEVLVIDKITYAGSLKNLNIDSSNIKLILEDINNVTAEDLGEYDYLVNFAAESHVDNSIKDGKPFIKSNVEGTFNLLEIARKNNNLKKFVQISTDEVYGDMDDYGEDVLADETFPLIGSSYYSSTKASADLLVQAAGRTYQLPYLITRTCNNYGVNQNKEKFLPTIFNCIKNDIEIPIYGDGGQIREWIWVEDNVEILYNLMINDEGIKNIGTGERWMNKELIQLIADILNKDVKFKFIEDRLGHDRRYGLKTTSNYKFKSIEEYLKQQLCEL